MKSDDLARMASLLELMAPTLRLYSETTQGDGLLSRITELSHQIEAIAAELTTIARSGKASRQQLS